MADRPIAWFILSPEFPRPEKLNDFSIRHPELKQKVDELRAIPSVGVAMYRLRHLVKDHPEFQELLPPEGFDVTKLRRFAEDEIEARFERVEGVSQSNVLGGLEDELQVVVDPEKLAARQITLADVSRVLRAQNEDISAGDFWEGKRRWVVRTLSQFRSPEQVENQLLAVVDGAPVYVRDIGEVRLGYKKPDGFVRRFGESNISLNCIRETGANVLDVMEGLRKTARELNEGILKHRGLTLTHVYDETEYIYSAVGLVLENIYMGAALTMVVLMFCLHMSAKTILWTPPILITALLATYVSPWFFVACLILIIISGFWFARGSLIIGLAIPTSIVATFLVLKILGRSLNVISLAGLAFAVGVVVDSATVVLENIYRRYSLGEDPFTAAIKGSHEVWGAVVASTLTTVAVFLPVVFVEQEAGQLFKDISLAIAASVFLSMFISIAIVPPAAARLLRRHKVSPSDEHRESADGAYSPANGVSQPTNGSLAVGSGTNATVSEPATTPPAQNRARYLSSSLQWFGNQFVQSIVSINAWAQVSTLRRIGVILLLVGLSTFLSWFFWPKVEYLPSGNRNLVFGILLPPPGYNLDQLSELGETVETALQPYWDAGNAGQTTTKDGRPTISDLFYVARGRQVFMGLKSTDPLRAGELVPLVRQVSSQLPGTFAIAKQSSLFEQGLAAGRTIDIEISGPELSRLVALGGQVLGQVAQLMPEAQARPIPSLDLSSPELHVEPKLVQAAEMGVSGADLGFTVNALVDGAYSGDYFLNGKKIDLTLIGREQFSRQTQDIKALPIATPQGQLIPLESVAEVRLSSGPEQVNHRERMRAITIEVSPPENVAIEDAIADVRREIVNPLIASGQLEGGYQVNLSGTADKLRQAWDALKFNVALATLITYLLMAALFESWTYPFVIILSVPLGAVGGVLGLWLLNLFVLQPLDVVTMLGFVILIGNVVANPILIVHQTLNHIDEGMDVTPAVLESVRNRIRPIFITTITTLLGLIPLVVFPGAGSELYRGLGAVVLGGLTVSTVFTLILVPALFTLTLEARQWLISKIFRSSVPAPPSGPIQPTGQVAAESVLVG